MARRHHRNAVSYGHKHNDTSGASRSAKMNRKARRHGRKRNDAGGGPKVGAVELIGALALGVGLTVGGTLALSSTTLSAAAQDAILAIGGIAVGGAVLFFAKRPVIAMAIMTGPASLALTRTLVRVNVMSRAGSLVSQLTSSQIPAPAAGSTPAPAAGSTPAPAAGSTPAPSGWVTGQPGWAPQLAFSTRPDSVANMTTPMAYPGAVYGYG